MPPFDRKLLRSYWSTDCPISVFKNRKSAGLKDNPIVFLFSDTQIKEESFLEDINNILNSGDVPNIYAQDELDKAGYQIDFFESCYLIG